MITVLLFAHPRELLNGLSFISLSLSADAFLSDARVALTASYPILAAVIPSCAFAVGDDLIARDVEDSTLCGIEIALIPPVSGG